MSKLPLIKLALIGAVALMFSRTISTGLVAISQLDDVMATQLATISRR